MREYMLPPVILQVFIIFNILLANVRNLSKIHGMAEFDEHLSGQLNQRDADDAAYAAARNAQNYSEMQAEIPRLQTLIQDFPFASNHLEHAEQISEVAKLIASYADAIQ